MAVANVGVIGRTDNNFIDSILGESVWANSGGGSPVNLTYSFQTGATEFDGTPYLGVGWADYEKAAFTEVFATYESVINVTFSEGGSDSDFRFYSVEMPGSSLGAQHGPAGTDDDGLGVYNYQGSGWSETGLKQGGYGYITVLHELGHGMGLGHPHDGGFGSELFPGIDQIGFYPDGTPFGDSTETGMYGLNQGIFTTMSYNDGFNGAMPDGFEYGYQGSLGAFDIYALQLMYGANMDTATGDDVYRLPDVNESGTFWTSIWDAGGTDALSAEGSTLDSEIDLREAPLLGSHAGGYLSQAGDISGGYTIANGVTIENAFGGEGWDSITGNDAANLLKGNGGDDRLEGLAGDDQINGNAGDDLIDGDAGADTVRGGQGDDSVDGGSGNDTVLGDIGNDNLSGSDGDDYMNGGRYGAYAGNDSDTLMGGAGNDFLQGNLDADQLFGDGGNDTLRGGQGDDQLFGGSGDDHLYGDKGSDALNGGDGTDIAYLQGAESDYSRSDSDGITTLTHSDGSVETLVEMEEVVFLDGGGYFL
ncbi:M10 family metallopeptidase C-terminal domain-containing protein [Rhodovibrionaceae bacterium A322]